MSATKEIVRGEEIKEVRKGLEDQIAKARRQLAAANRQSTSARQSLEKLTGQLAALQQSCNHSGQQPDTMPDLHGKPPCAQCGALI